MTRIKTFLSKLLVAWKSENASHRIVLVAVFVGGIGMRIPFLFQPIMHDESYTYVHIAYRPLERHQGAAEEVHLETRRRLRCDGGHGDSALPTGVKSIRTVRFQDPA